MNGGGPQLIVISPGKARGRSIPLRPGSTEIGRDPEQALVLDDPDVSRWHAWLEWTGDRVVLGDLNSSNGTWVNGRRIGGQVYVEDGDRIRMGSTEFRFSSGAERGDAGGDRTEYHGGVHAGGHVTADRGGQVIGGSVLYEEHYEVEDELADTVNPFRAILRGGFGGLLTLVGVLLSVAGAAGFLYIVFSVMDGGLDPVGFDPLAQELVPGVPLLPASFGGIVIGGLVSMFGAAITRMGK